MRSPKLFGSMLVLAAALAAGCDNGSPTGSGSGSGEPQDCTDGDTPGCVVTSDKQRISSPDVPVQDQDALTSGNTAFALDLYQQVRGKPGNLFYSPFSVSVALAMTYAGAKEATETAMAGTMHFDLPQERLHPAFNWLDQELSSRGQGASGADGKAFRLNVVNALWGQAGYNFEAPFLDTLALNYGAGMRIVDFGKPQDSADLINGWVKEQTEGKIDKLVPAEAITPETVLILTNAIYFNAAWKEPFKEADTAQGAFEKADGASVQVDMMHGNKEAPYGEGADYQAVEIPYDGSEDTMLSMLLVMPTSGGLADFEAGLDEAKMDDVLGSLSTHAVDIAMPKFKFDYDLSLREALKAMGMGVAFEAGVADFTGINSKGQPFIQDVLHKAFVGVNEAGTEAAAATAVIVGDESAPEPAAISLDHPFLFFIRDNATGSVLFVGRVSDPS